MTAAAAIAAAAFVVGVAIGDGGDEGDSAQPSVASRLSVRQLAGQRLVAGFTGTGPPPALERMIRRGELAGVILFRANLPSRAAARRLTKEIETIRRPPGLRDPLLVMVDQEGGLVKRLAGPPAASAVQMGAAGPAHSRRQGRATGSSLARVGVNVDLAPVLDVGRSGGVIAETERAFGSTPARVAATAVPFGAALQAAGVAATAKHFPGLGSAAENTDFAVQRIGLSRGRLRAIDERPYRAYIAAGGKLVMLSTAIYPSFSPLPAAFARPLASGELRGRLGFDGVSISDALESAAVRAFGGPAKAARAGTAAGTDLLLFADYRAAARAGRALRRLLRASPRRRAGFEVSVGRELRLRHWLATGARRSR